MNDNIDEHKWTIVESSYIVNDRWLKVRSDTLLTSTGKTITPWYVLEYPEWVNCLVIDHEDNVILLSHYRHGVKACVTEIIGGVADSTDVSTVETVRRELHEEIGLDGGEIYKTGAVYANPSNQNNKVHMFLAVGGKVTGEQLKELAADFTIQKMPFKEFYKMIVVPDANQIFQGLHMASVFYSLNFIKNAEDPSEQLLRLRSLL